MGLRSIAVFGIALSTALALQPPLPGYTVEDFEWQFEAPSGKSTYNVTGTVEEVVAYLKDVDSGYKVYFDKALAEKGNHSSTSSSASSSLSKREVTCDTLEKADRYAIEDGIRYLRSVEGFPSSGPGPHACGRVSCSYNAAIWWCNDNDHDFSLSSWNTIADAAQNIIDNCFANSRVTGSGVDDHADKWRGVVRGDEHC